ncbi:MAG: N-acetylneuraminate synthase [Candidatus Acidoferrum typicum]|nr:N-acetylneuraminate synthase [Candidatus Acidoferrum typicum]
MASGLRHESHESRGQRLAMQFDSNRCFIIGEVAQAHDGSLGAAHAYIDVIARSGADAVKFQTHIAAAESTPGEPWRVSFSFQDESRYAYWKRMEFTEDQWLGLKRHAEERGLEFLSSPFSIEAAKMLRRTGVRAWKVASGEVSNPQLFNYLIDTRLPILLSTGMSTLQEVDTAVMQVQAAGVELAVMQCTSIYPCPAEKVGLNMIPYYRQRYGCAVGLSDHSATIFPCLAGASIGVEVLEVHVTFSHDCFGPDVVASLTSEELATMIQGVRFIEKMTNHIVIKDELAKELAPVRDLFTKSIVADVDLPVGALLTPECLTVKKPGTGIPAERLPSIIGRRVRRPITAGEMLSPSDFNEDRVPQCPQNR